MAIGMSIHGNQVDNVLEIKVIFSGIDCTPGDKWQLAAAGVSLEPVEQEIPAGATGTHTLTWKTSVPLCGTHPNPLNVELLKTAGAGVSPTPVRTVPVNVRPAAPATAAGGGTPPTTPPSGTRLTVPSIAQGALPDPLNVRTVRDGGWEKMLFAAGNLTLLSSLLIAALLLLYIIWRLFTGDNPTSPIPIQALCAPPASTPTPTP